MQLQTENLEIVVSEYKDYGYENNNSCHVRNYILPPVLKSLVNEKKKLILDVGCGNGWLVNELIELGFDAYGIDASETGIGIANRINSGRFFVHNVNKDELPLELCNNKFEVIISTEVIEHIYNPKKYIQFCKSILMKAGGGKLIITTPYHGYLKNLFLAFAGKMDYHYSPLWIGGHIKFWSKKTLTKLLTEENFRIEAFEGCGRFPYLWKSMLIKASINN